MTTTRVEQLVHVVERTVTRPRCSSPVSGSVQVPAQMCSRAGPRCRCSLTPAHPVDRPGRGRRSGRIDRRHRGRGSYGTASTRPRARRPAGAVPSRRTRTRAGVCARCTGCGRGARRSSSPSAPPTVVDRPRARSQGSTTRRIRAQESHGGGGERAGLVDCQGAQRRAPAVACGLCRRGVRAGAGANGRDVYGLSGYTRRRAAHGLSLSSRSCVARPGGSPRSDAANVSGGTPGRGTPRRGRAARDRSTVSTTLCA